MGDPDRRDALIIRVDRGRASPERVRFEPRSDGRYERVQERHNGCTWVPRGREIVEDVTVEGRPEALA